MYNNINNNMMNGTLGADTSRGSSGAYVDHPYRDYASLSLAEANLLLGGPPGQQNSLAWGASQQQGFAVKLYHMLSEAEATGKTHIVSWQPHGRCFLVHDRKAFVEQVLPSYFLQSTFASFQRQLNLYGFKRISSSQDKGGYYNELFLKGKPELACFIKRIKRKGTGPRKPDSPDNEPNFYAMPTVLATRRPTQGGMMNAGIDCFGHFQESKPAAVQVLSLKNLLPGTMLAVCAAGSHNPASPYATPSAPHRILQFQQQPWPIQAPVAVAAAVGEEIQKALTVSKQVEEANKTELQATYSNIFYMNQPEFAPPRSVPSRSDITPNYQRSSSTPNQDNLGTATGGGMVPRQGSTSHGSRATNNAAVLPNSQPSSRFSTEDRMANNGSYGTTVPAGSAAGNNSGFVGGQPMPPMPLIPSPEALSHNTSILADTEEYRHGPSSSMDPNRGDFAPLPLDSNEQTTAADWKNAFGEEEDFWCRLA